MTLSPLNATFVLLRFSGSVPSFTSLSPHGSLYSSFSSFCPHLIHDSCLCPRYSGGPGPESYPVILLLFNTNTLGPCSPGSFSPRVWVLLLLLHLFLCVSRIICLCLRLRLPYELLLHASTSISNSASPRLAQTPSIPLSILVRSNHLWLSPNNHCLRFLATHFGSGCIFPPNHQLSSVLPVCWEQLTQTLASYSAPTLLASTISLATRFPQF